MKPLKKSERKRFEAVCEKIREHLHLEHHDATYEFVDYKGSAEAWTRTTFHGWYVRMEIYPVFWRQSYEKQVRCLIHEHVHACLIPLDQWICFGRDRLPKRHREWFDEAHIKGTEISVLHFESVLFDLLRDKLGCKLGR